MSAPEIGNDNVLHCPACGEIYLHHVEVEVWDRKPKTDESIVTKCSTRGATIKRKAPFFSSGRERNGMRIKFWCECCHAESVLDLVQHKGHTLMEWEG